MIDVELGSCDELESLVERAQQAGATLVAAPKDMPWGQRYAIIADPDGYRWGFKSEPRNSAET